ncbi:serine/threonine-protein kinase, putative [Leishmania tarentolae]|uniref:Serine/threonine-protein kinase, putative n=1 Tax=Leishmania tarentolae TaxID=5689 RepID=A0A640KSG3_LEITA|nr:serine/threonine-protein kinase, putative [Leishmania tarentolae]
MSSPCPSSSSPFLGGVTSGIRSPSRDPLPLLLHHRHAPMRLRCREDGTMRACPEKFGKDVDQACPSPLPTASVFSREKGEPDAKRHHAEPSSCLRPGGGGSAASQNAAATTAKIAAPLLSTSNPSSREALSPFRFLCTSSRGCPVAEADGARVHASDLLARIDRRGSLAPRDFSTTPADLNVHSTAAVVRASPSSGAASPLLSATCPSMVSGASTETSTPSRVLSRPHRIHQHELRPADFHREEVLGEGSYSIVTLATHRASGLSFALKEIDRSRLQWRPLEAQLRWEINLQRTLRHPHIVRLYSYFITPDCISLVLEYCSGGTLLSRLRAAPHHRFSERQASRYTRHVAKALTHLHGLGVAHRDLKLENVLISADDIAKLADFGWSRPVVHPLPPNGSAASAQTAGESNSVPRDSAVHHTSNDGPAEELAEGRRTVCGTLDYLSPEMVSGQVHSAKTDVWSLGVMLAEMLTGTPPFYSESTHETLYAIKRLPPNLSGVHSTRRGPVLTGSGASATANVCPTHEELVALSPDALSLICAMLQKDPSARPTMSEVLGHPWLQKPVRRS